MKPFDLSQPPLKNVVPLFALAAGALPAGLARPGEPRGGAAWPGEGSAAEAGWLSRADGRPVVDVTRAFRVLAATAEAGTDPLPPEARRCAYLFVGEALGAYVPGYLEANLRPFAERGFDARLLPLEPGVGAGLEAVAEAVARAAEAGRQVVLVGHGQGAVDAVGALSVHPELTPSVRALVALQAPFGGSALASDLAESEGLGVHLSGALADLAWHHPAALDGMTYAARRAFVAEHPLPLDVPAVCLATSRRAPGSSLHASEDYLLQRYGQSSDGLVLPEDAVLPGARRVWLEDLDHVESVLPGPSGASPRPAELTLALVALALRVPPPAALALRAAA